MLDLHRLALLKNLCKPRRLRLFKSPHMFIDGNQCIIVHLAVETEFQKTLLLLQMLSSHAFCNCYCYLCANEACLGSPSFRAHQPSEAEVHKASMQRNLANATGLSHGSQTYSVLRYLSLQILHPSVDLGT